MENWRCSRRGTGSVKALRQGHAGHFREARTWNLGETFYVADLSNLSLLLPQYLLEMVHRAEAGKPGKVTWPSLRFDSSALRTLSFIQQTFTEALLNARPWAAHQGAPDHIWVPDSPPRTEPKRIFQGTSFCKGGGTRFPATSHVSARESRTPSLCRQLVTRNRFQEKQCRSRPSRDHFPVPSCLMSHLPSLLRPLPQENSPPQRMAAPPSAPASLKSRTGRLTSFSLTPSTLRARWWVSQEGVGQDLSISALPIFGTRYFFVVGTSCVPGNIWRHFWLSQHQRLLSSSVLQATHEVMEEAPPFHG